MKRILLLAVGMAFLFSLPSAFAQGVTVPMYFNGGYQGDVWSGGPEGSVATGFYDGSINNVNVGPGQNSPGMICDDYYDNITAGEHWTATAYQVSSLNAGNIGVTLFGHSPDWSTLGMSAIQGYSALAYLANYMFTAGTGNSALQSAISQALWYITSAAKGPGYAFSLGDLNSEAQWLVGQAEANDNLSLSTYTNLWLYTQPFNPTGPQEMWGEIAVPEGGAALMYLLLAGITSFGAMFYSRRRRTTDALV